MFRGSGIRRELLLQPVDICLQKYFRRIERESVVRGEFPLLKRILRVYPLLPGLLESSV